MNAGDAFRDWATSRLQIVGESEGNELVAICPWPDCGADRLYINPTKVVYICFKCRRHGAGKYLIAEVESVPVAQANDRLRDKRVPAEDALLREIARSDARIPDLEGPVYHPLPDEFIPCYTAGGWRVPRYLDERGITDAMIIRHGLGYAKRGKFRNRVILPIFEGGHQTFLSRLMGHPEDFAWKDKETGKWVEPPKYLTPKNAGLSRTLYGSTWVSPGADLSVVEGSFDVMRMIDLGFDTVGVLGKRLSDIQAGLISRLKPRSVTFLYDAGAYSEAALDAETLSHRVDTEACPVYVARLPPGADPDKLGLEGGRDAIRGALDTREPAESGWAALEASLSELE